MMRIGDLVRYYREAVGISSRMPILDWLTSDGLVRVAGKLAERGDSKHARFAYYMAVWFRDREMREHVF